MLNEAGPLNRDEISGVLYRRWVCASPRAALLLVHGLGGHSDRWDFLAGFFLAHGICSYALELRGFGEADGLKGHIDSFDVYFNDIRALRGIIRRESGTRKIFLVGESMGGLIAFLTAGLEPSLWGGLICLSPAFKSRLKFSWRERLAILLSMAFNPKARFRMPFDSRMCTRDADRQKAMDADSREHRWATAKLLSNISSGARRAHLLKDRIGMPVLFLTAGDLDALVDPGGARRIFDGLATADKNLLRYPEMLHALSIESGREKIFQDMLAWMNARILPEAA